MEDKKYTVESELCGVIMENGHAIAFVRKNGELAFSEANKMGFDDIIGLLRVIAGQSAIRGAK